MNAAGAIALAICACAGSAVGAEFAAPSGEFVVRIESIQDRRFRGVVPQTQDFSCGAAAAATLMTSHYGLLTGESEALVSMLARGDAPRIVREGFSMLDLKGLLVSRGLKADGYRMSIDELARLGVPAIALLDTGGYRHFVVVQGVLGERVLLADPAVGLRTLSRSAFERQSEGILLVVADRARMARSTFNDERSWRRAPPAPFEPGLGVEPLAPRLLELPGPREFR